MVVVAVMSTAAGCLILRRRGVYFSLLTLALSALTYTVSFRWTEVTGGEDGLSGLKRGTIGPIFLDDGITFYVLVAVIGLCVLYLLLRVVRSPFGHVLVAIRENQLRATFQGYAIDRYKLAVFVLSAVVAGLAGALLGFQTYLVSAEAVSVPFSGELLAMVVIGGMHHILGPALGALFFILFPRVVLDLDAELAALVRPSVRLFRTFLAERSRRHLDDDPATLAALRRKRRRR